MFEKQKNSTFIAQFKQFFSSKHFASGKPIVLLTTDSTWKTNTLKHITVINVMETTKTEVIKEVVKKQGCQTLCIDIDTLAEKKSELRLILKSLKTLSLEYIWLQSDCKKFLGLQQQLSVERTQQATPEVIAFKFNEWLSAENSLLRHPYLTDLNTMLTDNKAISTYEYQAILDYSQYVYKNLEFIKEMASNVSSSTHHCVMNISASQEQFIDIIIKRKLPTQNKHYHHHLIKLCIVCTIPLIGFSLLSNYSFFNNETVLSQLTNKSIQTNDSAERLKTLIESNLIPDKLKYHFGLYEGNRILQALQPYYQDIIQHVIVPTLQTEFEQKIQLSLSHNDHATLKSNFIGYQMLSHPHYFNADVVTGLLPATSPLKHYGVVLQYMQNHGFEAITSQPNLIKATLQQLVDPAKISREWINTQKSQLGEVRPLKHNIAWLNTNAVRIPWLFTRSGYSDFQRLKATMLQRYQAQSWYYTLVNKQLIAELAEQLNTQYTQQYIDAWHSALAHLTLKNTNSLDSEIVELNQIKPTDILTLLHDLNAYGAITDDDNQSTRAINALFNYNSINVLKQSQRLNNISKKLVPILQSLVNQPNKIIGFMTQAESMQGIPSLNELQQLQYQSPTIIQPMIKQWISVTMTNLFTVLKNRINLDWQTIYDTNQSIFTQRYPFNLQSKVDSTAYQWTQLFAKNGSITQFIDKDISPFIELTSGQRHNLYGHHLEFTPKTFQAIQFMNAVSQQLFDTGKFNIPLTITPQKLSSTYAKAILTFEHQTFTYQHQVPKAHYIATNQFSDTSISQFSTIDFAGNTVKSRQRGPWSWLRLLTENKFTPVNKTTWDVQLQHSQGAYLVTVHVPCVLTELMFENNAFSQLNRKLA